MAHAYTPGLRVTGSARLRRERRLPLRGAVLVARGDRVSPGTVVARTELPGNVQIVNLAARLSLDPARAVAAMLVPAGASVAAGDVLARTRGLFGWGSSEAAAPCAGVVESVSPVTGQLVIREAPIPVEVRAYVSGVVAEVLPEEGVVVESHGAFLQGIFGVGGEASGALAVPVLRPDAELRPADLGAEHRGRVVVGGAHVSYDTLLRARDVGVAAVVTGGFDDADLRRWLGRDLGVAITGGEALGLTLVLTEGFGRIPMAERTWQLLRQHEGREASVSGATQIRAGVLRPEIVIPLDDTGPEGEEPDGGALAVGALVRVIREPWFGRLGRVTALPVELRALETEAVVRVLELEFLDTPERRVVPRANVERIAP
ncbi:MAG: hypothetical protein U0704_12200 [Candidatus Eisenbacteria bacterium]